MLQKYILYYLIYYIIQLYVQLIVCLQINAPTDGVYYIIYSIILDVFSWKTVLSMISYLSKWIRIELHVNWVAISLLIEIQLWNLSQYPAQIAQLKIQMLNIYKNDFVLLIAK